GEEHVLRVDQVVARVLRDLVLVAERDRVERAGELAVAAEDAAAHVDLVDARVALTGGDAVRRRVLLGHDADAVGRAGRRAERAADALLEPVFVPVQPVPPAEARIDRPLVLRVLLCDRLLEDLFEGDPEAPEAVGDPGHQSATTSAAVTSALIVAAGRSTFQPNRISWSYRRRGSVARSQRKTNRINNSLIRKQTGRRGDEGAYQLPKKSVTSSSERGIMFMYAHIMMMPKRHP